MRVVESQRLAGGPAHGLPGRIVYEGAIADLKRSASGGYKLRTTDDELALRVCRGQPGIEDARREDGVVRFAAGEEAAADLSVALVESGAAIVEMARQAATLEELFFELTEGPQEPAPQPELAGKVA